MTSLPLDSLRRADFLRPQHQIMNIARILLAHGLLLGIFTFLSFLPFWLALVPALAAAWVHQRLVSEMVHEASHFNILADKTWNDRVGNWLLSYLHGYSIETYRKMHMHHHASAAFFTPEDPDTNKLGIRSKKSLATALLQDITGLGAIQGYLHIMFARDSTAVAKRGLKDAIAYFLPVFLVQSALLTAGLITGMWMFYFLYLACLITLYPLLNRIRIYGQHLAVLPDNRVTADHTTASRTIDAGLLDRLFFTSDLMMYHNEHHEKPHLPYRALKAISKPSDDPNKYMDSRWPLLFRFYRSLPAA